MLKGKYAKLRDDLKKALVAGEVAEINSADGGTCNFDSSGVQLSRWNKEMVRQAVKEAGTHAYEWSWLGGGWWVICPKTHSQGLARTNNAEAVTKALADSGYTVCGYYAMD